MGRHVARRRMATAAGYAVSAGLLAAVLGQAPWDTIGAAVGIGAPSYDEAAVASTAAQQPAAPGPTVPAAPTTSTSAEAVPWHGTLRVSAWGRSFPVVDVARAADGSLTPPDDVATLGRWDRGAVPGQGTGAVALVVHRDSSTQGRGPFAELELLPIGSEVRLAGVTYALDRIDTYPKDGLPAQQVFGTTGAERLVIVTCGGDYSATRGWSSNVVAGFEPVAP